MCLEIIIFFFLLFLGYFFLSFWGWFNISRASGQARQGPPKVKVGRPLESAGQASGQVRARQERAGTPGRYAISL